MSAMLLGTILSAVVAVVALLVTAWLVQRLRHQREAFEAFRERYEPIVDVEAEKEHVTTALETQKARLTAEIEEMVRGRLDAERRRDEERARWRADAQEILAAIEELKAERDALSKEAEMRSFGEEVYKIGMTRRLDPMDRVRELGDASVPFRFDVHAIIYSSDAPTLERALHEAFDDRRINLVNTRKEFFRVGLGKIEQVVNQHHGNIEFTMAAEAEEYRKTIAKLKKLQVAQQPEEPRVLPAALAGLIGEQPDQTVRAEA